MTDGLIRPASPEDVPEIVRMIRELAEYEKGLEHVRVTPEMLTRVLFGGEGGDVPTGNHLGRPAAWCHVVEHLDETPGSPRTLGGFALWFLNMSTWTGQHGIYLEDLYVRPDLRGRGYGLRLLSTLAALCVEHGYARLEWWVLDWNEPAIDFYLSQDAEAMDEWTMYRVAGDALPRLAIRAGSVAS